MIEEHKGYLISGSALPGPPNTRYWTMMATVLQRRRNGSVVELVRVQFDDWALDFRGLAQVRDGTFAHDRRSRFDGQYVGAMSKSDARRLWAALWVKK